MGLFALSLFSCNLSSHGPTSSSNDTIAFSGTQADCINTALPNLQNFFNAQASDEQVAQTWECLNGAVQTFERFVRPSDQTTDFTPDEFRSFVQKYFMGSLTISDSLLTEFMRIKQVLVGGTMDKITHGDLLKIESFLTGIEKEARAINPHMKVIVNVMNTSAVTVNEVDVNYAESQMIESATNIGKLFNGSQNPYNVSDFQTFMTELSALYDQLGHHWDGPNYIIAKLGAFSNAKAFFLRPSPTSIAATEWPELLGTASQIFGIWMRVSYILNPTDRLTTGYGLSQLILTLHKGFDILQTSMNRKANSQIDFEVFNNLLTTVFDLGLISNPHLVKNTLLNLAAPIFFKVYSPATVGVRVVPSGIDTRIFALMLNDFDGWAEMQQLYDSVAQGLPTPQSNPSLTQLQTIWKTLTPVHTQPYQEISDFFARKYPQQFNSNGTLIFEKNISGMPVDQAAFTGINWRRLFVSALVRGYAEDPSYHYTGVTEDQFHQFYLDVNQLGIDLKFLDSRTPNIWSSLFLYAHVFLYSSNTSARLGFEQGMDIISYSMSASKMSNRAYADLAANCPNLQLDVYNLPMIDVNCYRLNLRQKFSIYFQEMPHWVKAFNSWNDSQWNDFIVSIETLARVHGNSNLPMESADLSKMSNVFGYIESVYVMDDKDNSDTINLTESMSFYPLIVGSLVKTTGINNDTLNETIFTYIMKFGTAPSETALSLAKLYLWKLEKSFWAYEEDRIQMIKVLNALSSANRPPMHAMSLVQNPMSEKVMIARNPAMSTMTIANPNVQAYIEGVFANFSQVADLTTLFADPLDRIRIRLFEEDLAKH